MNFAQPQWLFLLLAIPLLLLFYLKNRVQREELVSSSYLWKKLIQNASASERQKLSKLPLSFYFWSLALVGLSFALGGVRAQEREPERWAIFFENSARIGTVSLGGKTRLEALKEKAVEFLRGLDPSAACELIVLPARGKEQKGSASQLIHWVQSLESTDLSCDLDVELARHLPGQELTGAKVILFSDHLPRNPSAALAYEIVGSASQNAGFVSAWVQSEANSLQLHAVIKNFNTVPIQRFLVAKSGDETRETRRMTLEAQQAIAIDVELPAPPPGGKFLWQLQPTDELAADDSLYLTVDDRPLEISVPAGNEALRRVFRSIGAVTPVERKDSPQNFVRGFWVGVESRAQREAVETAPAALYHPRVLIPNASSKLGSLLGSAEIRVEEACVSDSSSGEVYLWGEDEAGKRHPLIFQKANGVFANFALEKSNWSAHPSFPVFFAAWVESLRNSLHSWNFTTPSVEGRQRVGFYAREGSGFEGVNLLDPAQSENSGSVGSSRSGTKSSASRFHVRDYDWAWMLVALVSILLACVLEWKRK